ncbi:MAG: TPM domain-containing protein, partial [Actinomycetota bacterium]
MKPFAKLLDNDRIAEAIRRAEERTNGEIRVHISPTRAVHVQREAESTFERLGMTATKQRNAVLLYLAPRSRQFAVVGDVGIHERCGDRLWGPVAAAAEWEFRSGRFT